MYAVIQKPEVEIPTVINENSSDFPTYLLAGYEIVFEGHKNECLEVERGMLEEFRID